jgi:hypothetical protein
VLYTSEMCREADFDVKQSVHSSSQSIHSSAELAGMQHQLAACRCSGQQISTRQKSKIISAAKGLLINNIQ